MPFKTFAVATPLSLAAWFGIYELAVASYGLVASLAAATGIHAGHLMTLSFH
jgi:hypothetical protein